MIPNVQSPSQHDSIMGYVLHAEKYGDIYRDVRLSSIAVINADATSTIECARTCAEPTQYPYTLIGLDSLQVKQYTTTTVTTRNAGPVIPPPSNTPVYSTHARKPYHTISSNQ